MSSTSYPWNRRKFLQAAGSTAAFALTASRTRGLPGGSATGVSLVVDTTDAIAGSAPVSWALTELRLALTNREVPITHCKRVSDAKPEDRCIIVSSTEASFARKVLSVAHHTVSSAPEAVGLIPGRYDNRDVLLVCGSDIRGLIYGLLELTERARYSDHPIDGLAPPQPLIESPANRVRSITRLFTSDVEDKPWFNDREMWPQYLTMLASQRFNRFNLAFGIGYDFLRHVTDAYFLFTYPFFLAVPGYPVRVPQLPDSERESNLKMLQYIGEQTVARGLEFQIGLWMHGYEWIDSPHANYTIDGLTPQTHAAYCRDAVRMLLQACPSISGVTFRIHGESGVQEGSYAFWKTVFDGVASCGRKVRLDMHSKGMNQTMLDTAVATGLPVSVSPKFWGEHLGMTYHQADIREMEWPKPNEHTSGLMRLSSGERSFLRYGYGDLLRANRKWEVVHRIWPGTQRLLLWGDPVTAAAYSRAFSFCGSAGVEICEPLSFKGRRGSGIAGNRCAYADTSLIPHWDWQKYLHTYCIWGRHLYNPDTAVEVWQRSLKTEVGAGAQELGEALSHASRILPIVTTAHAPSAGNNTYWPELYLNQSMIDGSHPGPYTDTPAPKVFGNVSPFDPQLFSRINDYADELLHEEESGKYSPVEVAQWIEDNAKAALLYLNKAEQSSSQPFTIPHRRMAIDIFLQAQLGLFFGAKFRSGVLLAIYEKTQDGTALKASLDQYREARSIWAELAEKAKGVYMTDITIGELPQLRGHWIDRLPAIDADIEAIRQRYANDTPVKADAHVAAVIQSVLGRPKRITLPVKHIAPPTFLPGQPLSLTLSTETPVHSVNLYYRHVDQAERYVRSEMSFKNGTYTGTIPGAYTDSEFPLEYYFQLKPTQSKAFLYPGFSPALTNQPYFVIRRR